MAWFPGYPLVTRRPQVLGGSPAHRRLLPIPGRSPGPAAQPQLCTVIEPASANACNLQSAVSVQEEAGTKSSARPLANSQNTPTLPPVTPSAFSPVTSDFSAFPKAKYIGCYLDDTRSRALRGVSFFDYKKMTIFRCQDNCAER